MGGFVKFKKNWILGKRKKARKKIAGFSVSLLRERVPGKSAQKKRPKTHLGRQYQRSP